MLALRRITTASVTTLVAAGSLYASAAASAAPKFQMPFRCHKTVYGQARADHNPPNSIDFNGLGGGNTDLGMPVVAAARGKVRISTYYTSNGYGNAIEIRHRNGYSTFYAHLKNRKVKVGQHVRRGQLIGHVGHSSATYTFSAHLHYEERLHGSVIKARFNGHLAKVYSHMEHYVKMTSRNCGGTSGGGGTSSKRGVALPKTSFRRAATIRTDHGLAVSVRRAPRTSAKRVLRKHDGDRVKIVCQVRGERVRGKYGRSRLWDLIAIGNGRGAYVTDTYVYTGSDGRVAPDC
jgi:hypothetical protein